MVKERGLMLGIMIASGKPLTKADAVVDACGGDVERLNKVHAELLSRMIDSLSCSATQKTTDRLNE